MSRSRAASVLVAALLALSACGADNPSGADTRSGAGAASSTAAAPGTVVATGLTHVSALARDPAGNLWAATAGYRDDGSDGVWVVPAGSTTPTRAVSGLHTPLGLLWIGGSLYVSSTAEVDLYTGWDGTAFTGHSTVVTLPDGVGEVNGLALGPDGRIHLGISAPCDACTPASPYSGSVVSFAPDGTDRRVDATHVRAPVGLAYDAAGDLLVSMNQRDDLGEATPGDWLSVVTTGQDWGFPACYGQGGPACAGTPAPLATLDPHAAVSGVAVLGDDAYVAEWATGTVQRVSLDGSGTVTPLVTGLQNPMPVVADGPGGLLVGEWGTGSVYRVTT